MEADETADEFITGPWPAGAAWFAFTFVALGTARNAYRHLICYSRPDLQQHVLRIIMVGPIYAFCAALCLSMDERGCFFVRSVRDIWEAVVIYSFLTLIIEYMGGEHLCLHSISQREEAVPHLFPFNLCLKPIPTGSMIRLPKIGALQFVGVKPVVAIMSIVVYACGAFENWYYQWTLFVVYNISYSVALYALYLIYWASHDHPSLQAKRPLLKFLSVKMIVFLTFWQALLLPHAPLPGSPGRWEDFILSVEMVCFGLLMNAAFSWNEFHSGLRGSTKASLKFDDASDAIGIGEATVGQPGATGQPVSSSVGRGHLVKNAKAAFFPRDIFDDASANFSRRYQQHVLIESAQEYELHACEAPSTDPEAAGGCGTAPQLPPAAAGGEEQPQQQQQQQQPQQQPGVAPVGGKGGALRTFRARTYLIGRSLGFHSGGESAAHAAPSGAVGASLSGGGAAGASPRISPAIEGGAVAACPSGPLSPMEASPAGEVLCTWPLGPCTCPGGHVSAAGGGDIGGSFTAAAIRQQPAARGSQASAAATKVAASGAARQSEAAAPPVPLEKAAPLHRGFEEAIGQPTTFGNPFD